MAGPVLIDTSCWVEALRSNGDLETRARVQSLLLSGRARICAFVRLELRNGIGGPQQTRWLRELEGTVEEVPTDEAVWEEARQLAARSRAAGLSLPASDLLIAACACVHGLELFHRDGHFDRLSQLLAGS
jgi:predicted nucleic acid-binding protein